jgi:hypothetical protein
MSNNNGDRHLENYIKRTHENGDNSVIFGTEILTDIDGMVIQTNLMSDSGFDYSGTITLKTDSVNHPGMIFYSLDDGKTREQKIKELALKVTITVGSAVLMFISGGAGAGLSTNPIPAF